MSSRAVGTERVFKTAWFARAARKSHIADRELCAALAQVKLGQADDLGGGVFKKRLGKNLYRSIVLAKGGERWIYEYVFAKQDRANIDEGDLARLRRLAKTYEALSNAKVEQMILDGDWEEICL